jgi:hypothetical protein
VSIGRIIPQLHAVQAVFLCANKNVSQNQADREGRACYLESSNDINPVIYAKMGFEVVKEISLQRDKEDIKMDIMVREPK